MAEFGMTVITRAEFGRQRPYAKVSFHRTELSAILSVYGRMVAAGEWKDYSIDFLRDVAIFSVFRRASEHPMFRIEKRPALAHRQGAYCVVGHDGHILKRGRDLAQTLRVFDACLLKVIEN
jgi:phage gpG-like protein